jgi:type IV pilus assembly protein PilM
MPSNTFRSACPEVNIDYQVVGPSEGSEPGMEVLLVAAKKEKIQNHANVISMAGRSADVVDIDAFALQNAFEANYSVTPGSTVALLNIGASLMNINITKGGLPLFIRDVPVGGNQYTDILQKELQLEFQEAEDLKLGRSGSEAGDGDAVAGIHNRDAHHGSSENFRVLP